MNKSISQRMNQDILITFAVIAVLFVVLGSFMLVRWKDDNIHIVCRILDTLVAREQDNLANELFERRIRALDMRLAEISMVEEVLRVELYHARGLPLAAASRGAATQVSKPIDIEGWDHAQGYAFDHDFSALRFIRPIIAAGETIGWLRLDYDLSLLRKQTLSFLAYMFSILVMTLLCTQLLLRRRLRKSVVNPLQRLGASMREMNTETRTFNGPALKADEEIATLGQSFQELLERLNSSYRDLDEAHQALARSERRLSRAILASSDGIWEWSFDTGQAYFSPRWYEMLGYEDQELPMTFQTWKDLCHPEDFQQAYERIQVVVNSNGGKSYNSEFRMRTRDGEWRWILGRGDVIERDADGRPLLVSGTHTDVTERRLAEERLRQSEEKFSQLFRLSPDAIVLLNVESGRLVDVNDSFTSISGFSREEALGKTLLELGIYRNPGERDEIYRRLARDGFLRDFEFEALHKDGSTVVSAMTCQTLELDGVPHLLAVLRDMTQMKKLREVMIQSEKMRSVGGMAAGIAHEINNPLGIILQASHNLVRRTRPDFSKNTQVAETIGLDMELMARYMRARKLDLFITDIQEAATRAAGIIRRMLDFSRLAESGRSQCDLQTLIEHSLTLARNDYDLKKFYDFKKMDLRISVEEGLGKLACTETEIEQVFLNILRNAAQAMAEATPTVENPRLEIRARRIGNRVRIEIEDNGPGMSAEISRRIFEPFFTTKPPGQGTGLGLSVSYFIVTKGHGGTMEVESEPGLGTRFIIELPFKKQEQE
ncbi:PAS domain S-box-containing protein [Desulfomicrobium norvegicum]|uniref:histidine kinase n=1 Tax=Desulfomicrobium norvegicum (strain DSM 1741 / NCIMB 8310) TaxID=52561 RepID=A0A8G2C4C0_DESNO|nr:PAS domain S-box protein [Desulfomicrobium norvegicum]SFL84052.1 PAS domain S-box-containing protein [Desulfomicrobium norvegicum]